MPGANEIVSRRYHGVPLVWFAARRPWNGAVHGEGVARRRSEGGRWLLRCLYGGLFAFGVLNAPGRAADQNGWPFSVTPNGEPLVQISLVKFPQEEFTAGLTLQHELVFDGCAYRSRIRIPEIESYLITAGRTYYQWRRFNGHDVFLESGQPTRSHSWTLTNVKSDNYRIISDDESVSYVFDRCVIVEAVVRDREYRFDYEDAKLVRIRCVRPVEEEIVAIEYGNNDLPCNLRTCEKIFAFSYDENGQMTGCTETTSNRPLFSGTYRDGLLASIATSEQSFSWGPAMFTESFRRSVPLPPIVVDDGRYKFSTKVDSKTRETHFIAGDGTTEGRWELDAKTGRVRWGFKNQ